MNVWFANTAWMAPAAIPYRTDSPVSMVTFAVALLITLCLLGLLVAALLYVRRRGWIAWPGSTRAVTAPQDGIQLQASRRISMVTTMHVIRYQGQDYLIAESSRGAHATVIPAASHTTDKGTS